MIKMSILKTLGVLLVASVVSCGESGCRSGSKRFCGELDTAGPHCILCLRELWKEVGCEPEGTKSPDNDPVSVSTWNTNSVAEVLKNMEEYPWMADINPLFCYGPDVKDDTSAIPDQQTDAKSAPVTSVPPITSPAFIHDTSAIPDQQTDAKSAPVTSVPPITSPGFIHATSAISDKQPDAHSVPVTSNPLVTSRDFTSASIWLPGSTSGTKTGMVHFNSTNSNSELPNGTTRTAVICFSVAGGVLALGSALAIYGIYRNRKKKRSQNKAKADNDGQCDEDGKNEIIPLDQLPAADDNMFKKETN